eukprot:scaffold945_cov170-Amphora_coffeaeformis.AAC.4
MDTGVELADAKRRYPNDPLPREVVPASEALYDDNNDDEPDFVDEFDRNNKYNKKNKYDHITNHPTVRRQNNWFLFALVLCVLAFAAYVISNVYLSNDTVRDEYGSTGGVVGPGGANIGIKQIGDAADSMHHTKGKAKDYLRKKKEIEAWQNATVTLRDGKKYKVLEQLKHDTSYFTEGLTYVNGRLFESVGLYHQSQVVELDPETGETIDAWPMDPKYFAEGLTYVDGKLIQLTYKRKTGFVYNLEDMSQPPSSFDFETVTAEGWGMTYNDISKEIIVSDGSTYLLFWDPNTFQELRRVKVQRQFGKDSRNINELEFWRGRVLANVWYEDTIIVINPENGVVEKEYGEFVRYYLLPVTTC